MFSPPHASTAAANIKFWLFAKRICNLYELSNWPTCALIYQHWKHFSGVRFLFFSVSQRAYVPVIQKITWHPVQFFSEFLRKNKEKHWNRNPKKFSHLKRQPLLIWWTSCSNNWIWARQWWFEGAKSQMLVWMSKRRLKKMWLCFLCSVYIE